MQNLISKARRIVGRHPRFARWLANFIVRFPALRTYLARHHGIVLFAPQHPGAVPPGYRLPLATDTAELAREARDILDQLRR